MADTHTSGDFYIVGIGASAGGLDALERFFSEAPSDSGLAFVVIQHLSPDYKSLMADLLGKRTDMPVHVAEDGITVEPNHVYLIPPKQSLTIFHKKLYLTDRETGLLYLPIDIFFQSLAEDMSEKAIGVILSGTGSDGTRGIRAIKEKGGLVIVQDDQTAKFDGMPRSAIATNLVDYILPPEKMVREALTYIQHPYLISDPAIKRIIPHDDDSLSKIFALLRSNSGVDFTYYKQSTMVRRIERRMSIKQIEKLSDYLYLLHQTPAEANTLYREFLIGVTRFFRDAEAFEELKKQVIPAIFENKNRGETIRVWVAACSTGEEAYSIAILLTEYMETTGRHMDVKVFATDLDKNALEFAGKGIYPESIAADISLENLQNYFIKSGESYTVTRRVREMVIFAKQNIITDPPFSKVDLISCRNVLIYLQPVLQKKVISAFQFALNPDGFMFLGTSETIGDSDDYFECKHSKWKIYKYKGGFRPSLEDNHLLRTPISMQPTVTRRFATTTHNDWRSVENIQRGMIDAFLPPTAVVDEDLNLIYVSGDMDAYLRVPPGGLFTPNILKQAREGLSVPLSTAIHKVLKDQQEVVYKNIHFGDANSATLIDLKAKPYTEPASHQKMALLQFTPVIQMPVTQEPIESFDINTSAQQRIQDLEHELQYTRESLQATVEELETSNEELQATNEELFAANEELQSTNEELHSVNEELITVNAEYHAKIQELTRLNEDINNLLSSTDVGTIFLDRDLRIRLFTPTAQQEIHLLDQDVGRPISHVTHDIVDCDLVYESQQVLKTLASREMEVQNNRGRWYQMKLLPYYTLHQQVGGVVITLLDVTDFKQAEEQLVYTASYPLLNLNPIVEIDETGRVMYANPAAQSLLPGIEATQAYAHPWLAGLEREIETIKTGPSVSNIKNAEPHLREVEAQGHWYQQNFHYLAEQRRLRIYGMDITARKQAENELRKLSRVVEQGQVSVVITDLTGAIEYVNPRFSEVTGYSLEEARGQNPRILKSGYKQPEDYKEIWNTITKGHEWHGEFHNKKKNGELFWESAVISPITDEQGVITHFVAVKENITARKQAEQALHESQENFKRYFNMSTVGMCVTSPEKGWIETNDCLCNMLGYSREELQSLTWSELTHPEDLDKDVILFNQVLEGKIDLYQLEKRFIRKDKSIIHTALYVSCQRDPQGKARYFLASLVDITDRIKAEHDHRESFEKYQILFNVFPYGITVADSAGKILESNREAERILGLSKEAQVQRKIDGTEWQIVRPGGSLMSAEEYASVRALKENQRVENVVMGIQKSKTEIAWINVSAVPLGSYGVLVTYYELKEKPKASRRK